MININTLEDLATACGVTIMECAPEWGGKYAYKTDDSGCQICGFRTKQAAVKFWLEDAIGKEGSKAIQSLLKKSNGQS